MKFTTVVASALLASAAVAAPSPAERRRAAYERRVARRAANKRSSRPPIRANSTDIHDVVRLGGGNSFASYDSNWAGAVYTGSGISKVTATGVNVPSVSVPSGGSSGTQYGGSAWVGIDGESCAVILQTGIDWTVSGSSGAQYNAWYEWYPEVSTDFDITISEGDSISMQVVASSATSGTAYITNESTGQSVSQPFSGEQALCQKNAEWIVEDFESGSSLVPFAAFSQVTFNGASFSDGSGSHDTSGSNIVDIQQNSVLTDCSASGSTVTCSYTG